MIELFRSSSRDVTNEAGNSGRLINFYAEPIEAVGAAQFALRAVPGMEAFGTVPGIFPRAALSLPCSIMVVSDGQLTRLATDTGQQLGAASGLPDDPETDMSRTTDPGCMAAITAGGRYFVYDGTGLTEPTLNVFDDAGSVTFLGGYSVMTERGGRRFAWSALADASDWPATNFATAEAREDRLVRAVSLNDTLWLLGERSIEVWAITGAANEDAFARIPGGVYERGLRSFGLVAVFPGGLFFVGDDGICYLTRGAEIEEVGGPPVIRAIREGNPTSCFYYEDAGHRMISVRFADRPAWCLDLSTGLWHERASGQEQAWSAVGSVAIRDGWAVLANGGAVSRLRGFEDLGQPLRRIARSWTYEPGRAFRVPHLELLGRIGRADIGREARVMLRVSRDAGQTWGPEQWRGLGPLGRFDRKAVWRALGRFDGRATVELVVTDPADLTIYSKMVARAV